MKSLIGQVEGFTVAKYKKDKFTWTCKISGEFFCATFHNGRQTARTYYSEDASEINNLIKKELANGFKKIY